MRNKIVKIFVDILELDPKDIVEINEIFINVFEIHYKDSIYIIMNKDGEAHMIDEYRRASVSYVETKIPIEFQRYFNFGLYAEDTWQSVYDIYENVDEVLYEEETFYICLL